MKRYCPECRREMQCVEMSGTGNIYVCRHCHAEWVISKRPEGYEEEQN